MGCIAVRGGALAPDAPEKVLAVSARLDGAVLPLVRAVARAGRWCADPENRSELIHRLARATYLNIEPSLLGQAFADGAEAPAGAGAAVLRFDATIQEPRAEHAEWLLEQMGASRQIPRHLDLEAAATVYRGDLYRAAVADF